MILSVATQSYRLLRQQSVVKVVCINRGLSQARAEARRNDSGGEVLRMRFLGRGQRAPFKPDRRSGSSVSSPIGVRGKAPEKMVLVYFGASKMTNFARNTLFSCQFCYQYITEVFWQPTSMILHPRWAWQLLAGWVRIAAREAQPRAGGAEPTSHPHFNHWQQFGKTSGSRQNVGFIKAISENAQRHINATLKLLKLRLLAVGIICSA